jgi:hypothetical protein
MPGWIGEFFIDAAKRLNCMVVHQHGDWPIAKG